MYAFPKCLSIKYLLLWARYCLRNQHAGKYVVIFGAEKAGHRTQEQIDKDCGPCGLNPWMYLRIFKDVGDDEKHPDEEIRVFYAPKYRLRNTKPECVHSSKCNGLTFLTLNQEEWQAQAPELGEFLPRIATNDLRFCGQGIRIQVNALQDHEAAALEKEMETAVDDPDFTIPMKF